MAKKKRLRRINDLPGEEWREVEGAEGYWISNLGRFKKINHLGENLRKASIDSEGYCRINIGHKKLRLHRVVAEAFIPNPNNLPVIDHLDNDKQNCKASNLEWVTQKENTRRAAADGLIGNNDTRVVLAIDKEDNAYLFDSGAEAARWINTEARSVTKALAGKQPTVKGYTVRRISSFEDKRQKKGENMNDT